MHKHKILATHFSHSVLKSYFGNFILTVFFLVLFSLCLFMSCFFLFIYKRIYISLLHVTLSLVLRPSLFLKAFLTCFFVYLIAFCTVSSIIHLSHHLIHWCYYITSSATVGRPLKVAPCTLLLLRAKFTTSIFSHWITYMLFLTFNTSSFSVQWNCSIHPSTNTN